MLAATRDVLTKLTEADVRLVHWKSNLKLDAALAGETDLDLLIHPADRKSAEGVLLDQQFLHTLSIKDKWQPGIVHYYGLDRPTGRLVHLHLHYSLTLGFDYGKNYVLPFVDWYLENRIEVGCISTPEPEKELIVFVIRQLVKTSIASEFVSFPSTQIRMARGRQRTILSAGDAEELTWLLGRVDDDLLRLYLTQLQPYIQLGDFDSLVLSLKQNRLGRQSLLCSARVKRAMHNYRVQSELRSDLQAAGRLNAERGRRLLARVSPTSSNGKRLAGGGRIIAFIGGDGAGKSTNVAAVTETLARVLVCEPIHVGRPRRTLASVPLSVLSRCAPKLESDALAVGLAINRAAAFRRAQRVRARGGIAVLDRVTDPRVSSMDAPRILEMRSRASRTLGAIERRLYQNIRGADLRVILKLDPEIALLRRPEDDPELLWRRSGEVWDASWEGASAVTFDTGALSLDEVTRSVLGESWRSIAREQVRCEILGLSGTGKSTVTTALARSDPDSRTVLPYKRYPATVVKAALSEIRQNGVPKSWIAFQVQKNLAQLRWFTFVAASDKKSAAALTGRLTLDQGPAFQCALAIKEGWMRPGDELFDAAIAAMNRVYSGGVVVLRAPADVRNQRLTLRHNQVTRQRAMAVPEQLEFDAEYERALKLICSRLSRVTTVDATSSISEVADRCRAEFHL